MSKRALRRHHKSRVRRRAYKLLILRSWGDEYAVSNWGLRRADNFTVCSCPLCGNPRRHGSWSWKCHWGGRTRQEHLSDLAFKEQLDEIGTID